MSSKFQKKLDKKATRIEGLSSTSLDFRKTFKNVQVCINYYALIIMLYRNHA
jgi:adenylosuccinate synthase